MTLLQHLENENERIARMLKAFSNELAKLNFDNTQKEVAKASKELGKVNRVRKPIDSVLSLNDKTEIETVNSVKQKVAEQNEGQARVDNNFDNLPISIRT